MITLLICSEINQKTFEWEIKGIFSSATEPVKKVIEFLASGKTRKVDEYRVNSLENSLIGSYWLVEDLEEAIKKHYESS